ncbi:hypothetical protein [uncultured Rhodoblastus sp.]|uniref:hypothetical protein n=1 Tax=uncultured Rhodoblastus sp. TaxID=543037 RepID=UPI0025E924E7|nr:hypothetical protein [uncultured Rhodoblastus sp.]
MADYYPLLAKAVSGLKASTPETRQAIYERARKALLGQLRSMQPPAPEGAIEREAEALDEAIARLERAFFGAPTADVAEPARDETTIAEPAAAASAVQQAEPAAPVDEPEVVTLAPRENARPAAPKPDLKERGGWRRIAIVAGALASVLALVGFAAWKLRDNPEELARRRPTPEAAEPNTGGKIGERIGDGQASRNPAGAPGGPVIPVASRAAVLAQAPDEPGGVKTYIGSVVWRRDSANRGPNQQLAGAIRADIEIPEAKFKASVVMEKNYDTALSFSHTINLRFEPAAGSPIGDVNAINMPEMRRDDAAKGSPLLGLPVQIAPNVFLVGLASASETQNLDLLRGPNWIDIPMSIANSRVAKLTFEKGPGGDKLVADVLAEWKGP